ncbi:MAG TPA: hypothetical protein VJO52_09505 [Gemmatimonadaceae bacterium]|nr:hypothetical protein [Gemmatimonadaceae bacterium]
MATKHEGHVKAADRDARTTFRADAPGAAPTPAPTRPAPRRGEPRKTVGGVVSPKRPKRKIRLGVPADLAGTSATGSFPNFIYHGGPIINTPQVYAIFFGDWSSAANQTRATRLGQFVSDLLNSRYMNILSQYGCGTSGALVKSVFISSSDTDLSTTDVHAIVQNAIDNGDIPEPTNPSQAHVIYLDDATAVDDTTAGAVMCESTSDTAFGYHDFFTTTAGNPACFAVVPGLTNTCLTNSCPGDDGGCSLHLAQTQEQRQTQVSSHELSEMFSDPQVTVNEGWSSSSPLDPHENGDICNGQPGTITVGANTWTVQLMYSKWHDMNTNGATTCIDDYPSPLPSLLPACTVALDRSTFGKDEIDALLHLGTPATIDAAFYVIVDGYTPSQLGITPATLTGVPNISPTVSLAPAVAGMSVSPTSLVAEDPSLGGGIQRFTWVYDVSFTQTGGFPALVGGVVDVTLTASIMGVTPPALTASGSAIVELIHEPNPYELDGPVSWLSTDLRVFQVNAGASRFGATMGSTPADGPTFIQQVIANLNAGTSAGQTFDGISTDENASALELSETVNGTPVFNFAVAKVRYRSLSGDAPNVRGFFRLFPASTTSTAYDQATTYRRGGQSGVTIPLLGVVGGETATIPCFASPRIDTSAASMTTQADAPNVQTLVHDATGNEASTYFGCWLDINQSSQPLFPIAPSPVDGPYPSGLLTIQQLIRNAHQCLVAEIAFDPDPIGAGSTPGSSDKLAQRNLTIVASDNPGGPASHAIPTTFEVKRSAPLAQAGMAPDELLMDGTTLPPASEATLYAPGANARKIVEMANSMYVSHHLRLVDDDTLTYPARGLTFIPIPPGTGPNLPALLTVQLPAGVRTGQAFKAVVRQMTNAAAKRPVPPPPIGAPTGNGDTAAANGNAVIRWRRVVGSFQVSIPVKTKEVLLTPEERLLSVTRFILEAIPPGNRWNPVFGRYVDQIAARVKALGGDPDVVLPTPDGQWQQQDKKTGRRVSGKVSEVVFNCFGEFQGFVVDGCSECCSIKSSQAGIGDVVLKACKDRLSVTVWLDHDGDRVERVVVRS